MSESDGSLIGHEVVDQIIDKRMADGRKAEVLLIYDDLLQTIWDRILPTLGRVTTIAIMERAVVLAKEHYPVIGKLQVGANGVLLEGLKTSIEESEPDVVRAALKELVAEFIDILAMLTGDILVKQVIKEIEERRPS